MGKQIMYRCQHFDTTHNVLRIMTPLKSVILSAVLSITLAPKKWLVHTLALLLFLSVQDLEYSTGARSITYLLMPWLLVSPVHQQPRYWLQHWQLQSTCVWPMSRNDVKYKDMQCIYQVLFLKNIFSESSPYKGLECENNSSHRAHVSQEKMSSTALSLAFPTHWLRSMCRVSILVLYSSTSMALR